MRNYLTSLLGILLWSTTVHADDKDQALYAAAQTDHSVWQQTSMTMPYDSYQHSVHKNRKIVQKQVEVYIDRMLAKTGGYSQAISLLGSAVAVAATDQRYDLNDNKTFGLVLRDTVSSDRAVLFEYRKTW